MAANSRKGRALTVATKDWIETLTLDDMRSFVEHVACEVWDQEWDETFDEAVAAGRAAVWRSRFPPSPSLVLRSPREASTSTPDPARGRKKVAFKA